VARVAVELVAMSGPEREQRLVFGEVAAQYEAARPSYPDALFETIINFGGLQPGDRALEVGAGTGKATAGFLARGLDVHALEPSAEMAAVSFDWVSEGIAACPLLGSPVMRTVTWNRSYTHDQWVQLLGTHSDHRILPGDQRDRLHSAVGEVIDRHSGRVDVVYDVECYLSRRV
jgi:hypothetical protein